MGNCQVAEAATVAIQHPGGRTQRLYWPTTAEEVIKCNPGHHVALIVTDCSSIAQENHQDCAIRARARLLKPNHMLLTGQVYRLITDQEAASVLKARKHKLRRRQRELIKKQQEIEFTRAADQSSNELREERYQETSQDRRQLNSATSSTARSSSTRQWQPALHSIEEDGLSSESNLLFRLLYDDDR